MPVAASEEEADNKHGEAGIEDDEQKQHEIRERLLERRKLMQASRSSNDRQSILNYRDSVQPCITQPQRLFNVHQMYLVINMSMLGLDQMSITIFLLGFTKTSLLNTNPIH